MTPMNPVDVAMNACLGTIAQLQARIVVLEIENSGLRNALAEAQKTAAPAAVATPTA